jgi:hypothetical protein
VTAAAVAGLAAHDLPQQVQPTPDWSESYFSVAYAPDAGVGLYLRLVRCAFDVTLWCEVFLVYLPGDRFLVAKGFGDRQSPAGPAASGLSFTCDEPFERWTKRFHGAARLVPGDELRAGVLTDGPFVPVDLDVSFVSTTPIAAANLGDQFWAGGHYEQHSTVTGSLRYGDERIELRGTGMRDHSVGRRDLSGLRRHVWTVAQFPESGRTLIAMYVESEGGTLNHASIGGGATGYGAVSIVNPPFPPAADPIDTPFELTLATGAGPVTIAGQPLQTGTLSILGANEWVVGNHPGGHPVLAESMVRLEWDGEVGWGYLERSDASKGTQE